MAIVMRTTELGVLAADFGRWGQGLDVKAGQVVRKAALDIEGRAKVNAPVVTGFLMGSILSRITASNAMVQSAQVVAEASYATFVEFGTSRMAPRLFMTRAVDAVEPGFYAAMEKVSDPGWGGV